MATFYSEQRTNERAFPGEANAPNTKGTKKVAYFSYTTVSGNIGDVIELCKIPKGCRVIGGQLTWDAMTGGTQTVAIGISGTAGKYLTAVAMGTSEGNLAIGSLITQSLGEVTTAEETIILTNGTAAMTAAKKIRGYIEYIHN